MHLERNLNPPLRVAYVAIGVFLVAAAFLARRVTSETVLLLLIIGGVLSIASGAYGH